MHLEYHSRIKRKDLRQYFKQIKQFGGKGGFDVKLTVLEKSIEEIGDSWKDSSTCELKRNVKRQYDVIVHFNNYSKAINERNNNIIYFNCIQAMEKV